MTELINKLTLSNYKKALVLDWVEEECLERQLSPIYLDCAKVHKLLVNIGGLTEKEYIQVQNQWLDDEMNHRISYHNYGSGIKVDNLANNLQAINYIEQVTHQG